MTAKSYNLPKSQQKLYEVFYKDSIKRMNFNGFDYLTIFADAGTQYINYEKQVEDLFKTSRKKGTTKFE